MTASVTTPLQQAILQTLVQEGAPMSLPQLTKRLGLSGSVVLRELSLMGDAVIGGKAGPGWVRVWEEEGRWMGEATAAGIPFAAPANPPFNH